jgi:hypothetical protein
MRDKEAKRIYDKAYRTKNKLWIKEKETLFHIVNPWYESWRAAKERCENPKHNRYRRYGGRGIKFLLTQEQAKLLWDLDKAYLLKWPSIDRNDNNGNYEFKNCHFIEHNKNSRRPK